MAEREEVIRISAVNATRQAFSDVQRDLLRLGQTAKSSGQEITRGLAVSLQEVNRLTSQFSGAKIVTDAQNIAAAVARIGGSARLTRAEQQQVNRVVTEAIEKYRLLGQQAPVELLKLAAATKQVGPPTSVLGGNLQRLGPLLGTLGIGLSAASIVTFGKQILADADAVQKLSDKTGIGVEAVQRLKYAAEQSGNTFEQVTSAVSQMQNRLAEGDKSAVGALNQLGLSFETLRALSPDQQFIEIAREIAAIEDPMERTRLAMDLFGRSGAEILPTLRADMKALGDEAPVMSEKAVAAFDAIGDAAAKNWTRAKNAIGEGVSAAIDGYSRLFDASRALMTGDFARVLEMLLDLGATAPKGGAPVNAMLASVTANGKGVALSMDEIMAASRDLDESFKRNARSGKALKEATLDLFGGDVLKKALDYQRALGSVENASKLTTAKKKELHQAVTAALEVYRALGREAPQALRDIAAATQDVLTVTRAFSADTRFWVPLKAAIADTRDELLLLADSIDDAARRHAAAKGVVGGLWVPLKAAVKEVRADVGSTGETFTRQTQSWAQGLGDVTRAFANLAEISGRGLDGMIGKIARLLALMNVSAQAGQAFKAAFDKIDWGSAKSILTNAPAMAAAGIGGVGAIMQATDVAGRGNRALRGGVTGAQFGMAFGPIGAGIGFGVGAIVGALRNPAFEDVMKRLGREWGVNISEGLARAIADDAKKLFGKDRQTAEIFNLDKIIAEAGGVKPETLAKFTAKLHDAFSMREMGKFTQEQLTETVDKNFQALVDVAKKKNGLITAELREIMALNERFGSNSVAISEHVKNSIGAGLTQLTTFLQLSAAAAKDNVGEIAKDVQKLEDERDRLTAGLRPEEDDPRSFERDTQRITEINKEIEDLLKKSEQAKALQQGLAITSTRSAGAFASAIAGSFQKLLAEGVDPMEAIGQVEPAVLALQGQLDKLGMDGGEAFQALRAQIAMTRDEVAGPMVGGMRALGSSITQIYNAGILTDDMFAGMTAQIGQTFQALVAQGHNGRTAMSLMKPQLQAIWELQQRFGTELDESSQKLLDEAEAAGVVGDKHKNASERMVDGIGKVVDRLDRLLVAMGVELPDAVDGAAREIENKARDMRERIGSIFDDIPDKLSVDVDVNATYTRREGTDTTQPGGETGYAAGTLGRHGRWFRDFGAGTPTMLHGREAVVPEADAEAFAAAVWTPRWDTDRGRVPLSEDRARVSPPIEVILREVHNHPMLMVNGFGLSLEETLTAGERRLAQSAIQGNSGGSATSPGLRDVFGERIREIVRQELARA